MNDQKEMDIIRANRELDPFRKPGDPDTVKVVLVKEGLDFETQAVRILGRGLGDDSFAGVLLTEPGQDFGRHKGDKVGIVLYRSPENGNVLLSDLNPLPTWTREQLKDGSMLRAAIKAFNAEQSGEHWFDVTEILRDSTVFVPCDMKVCGEDERTILAMAGNDPQSLVGKVMRLSGDARFTPAYLENGEGECVLPVLSSNEKDERVAGFSLIPAAFTDVIATALGSKDPLVSGIVVDPFTDAFFLPVKILDIIANMPSRLED